MQDVTDLFVKEMYRHVGDYVARLEEKLAAFGTDLQDMQQTQIPEVQLQDLATCSEVQAVDARVIELDSAPLCRGVLMCFVSLWVDLLASGTVWDARDLVGMTDHIFIVYGLTLCGCFMIFPLLL